MRNSLLALLGFLAVMAVSCQKEVDYQDLGGNNPGTGNPGTGNPSNNSIIGDWKFKKMLVSLQGYSEVTTSGVTQKTILDINLATTNEAGILKIDTSTLTASGIAYSASSNAMMTIYMNGILLSQNPIPVQIDQPAINNSVKYTKVGADSLVAESTFIDVNYPGAPSVPDAPQEIKVSWLGDTLVLTQRINQEMIDNSLGIKMSSTGMQKIKLVKN